MNRPPSKPFRLSRRALLRGAGVGLALPWLEAMTGKGALAQAVPPRVFFVYFPSGYRSGNWVANGSPGVSMDFQLPAIARALDPFKKKLTMITGTRCAPGAVGSGGAGIHARGTGCWLTSEVLLKSGFQTSGVSADQIIAKEVGGSSCISSLALGIPGERPPTFAEDGYGAVYYNNISFTGPKSNIQKENKPADLFNRLVTCGRFGAGGGTPAPTPAPTPNPTPAPVDQRAAFEKSVMAAVKVEADRLMKCVGTADRLRLEEYFQSISELERRFRDGAGGGGGGPSGPGPMAAACEKPAAPVEAPSFRDNALLMMDLAILAFKCGLTRVATLMMDGAFSRRNYGLPDIGGVNYVHGLSHGEIGGKGADHPRWVKITTHYFGIFAEMLRRMDAIDEGNGTLLDNSIVYIGSEFGDGDAHGFGAKPLIIAGSGGGKLSTGRHISTANNTPEANVILQVMQAMGVNREKHGDSNGRIDGLSA